MFPIWLQLEIGTDVEALSTRGICTYILIFMGLSLPVILLTLRGT